MLGKALTTAAAAGNAAGAGLGIEDVFSTWLYTGNGSTQTITNGIDLAGEGGLVWIKNRTANPLGGSFDNHVLVDTVRGYPFALASNTTGGNTSAGELTFQSTGFTQNGNSNIGRSGVAYASWTFRKAPGFFDVVTYTGNGQDRTIAHNLGSVPGTIIVKRTDASEDWQVYHRSIANTEYLVLHTTDGKATGTTRWNSTTPTSTVFSLGTGPTVNASGGTYVAYLFAHDEQIFGEGGDQSVIKCGSYTGNGSTTGPVIDLGWEPQWLMIKRSDGGNENWNILDDLRGFPNGPRLRANLTSAEDVFGSAFVDILPTGFQPKTNAGDINAAGTYIYIAIRRGPMKKPTDATKVFQSTLYTGTDSRYRFVTAGIATDMILLRQRNDTAAAGLIVGDRLRNQSHLFTGSTAIEASPGNVLDTQFVSPSAIGGTFSAMTGFWIGNGTTARVNINQASNNHVAYAFRRAPGFFDVVAYTGTGVARTVPHNLGVAPELIICKLRSSADHWIVGIQDWTKYLMLSANNAFGIWSAPWNNTAPTKSVFTVGTAEGTNKSGGTLIAYLFATVPGVSKVGSYTGTGTTLNVDCGFTSGARFVLIKRTDSTGDWYVWDTARGIVSGNDPYLLLNSTAAEVTSTDYIDPYSAGFEISSTAPAAINANGGTYIYLAIA